MAFNIRLTSEEWCRLNELLRFGAVNKIESVKLVKAAKQHQEADPITGQLRSGVGLREAKEAVEHYMSSRGMKNADGSEPWSGGEPSARIVPFQPIRRIVIDMGEGEVEVDMDGMSLKFLSTMTTLKLEDVSKLVDLYNRVKDWEKNL
jgi:hypothetical protein